MRWLLLILLFPLIEISVFMDASQLIGVGWVMLLTLASAIWGMALVRMQGMDTYRRMQQRMASGETPAREMLEASLLLLAGFLLLLPGFIGDSFGALLLLPPLRKFIARRLYNRPLHVNVVHHNVVDREQHREQQRRSDSSEQGRIIDQKEPWD